ncbi:uncharacterized protein LOC144666103 isoform X2 [Oculina patagonica]
MHSRLCNMGMARVLSILVILCINRGHCGNNYTQVEINSSCVPAVPPVNATAQNSSCIFYNYAVKDGVCKNIITSLYVFGGKSTLQYGERQTNTFKSAFDIDRIQISEKCRPVLTDAICRYFFPQCDTSLAKPQARPICRKTCEYIDQDICKEETIFIRQAAAAAPQLRKYLLIINCTLYDAAKGGDAPECYQYHFIPGDDTKSTDCYHGIGIGYRGNVNITRSGRTCQAWNSQCPHRHWRIPEDVAVGQNDSNMCRNPDSSAPDGPWCYTTDPKVRWEYCNVSRCPPRVPEQAPTFLKGYPLNSTAIHVSWKSLPPSRHKEQLLGYRVKYRRLRSQVDKQMSITSNFTETVITRLDAQTKYEIEVNGFNEIGHGPSSKILVVKTASSGEVTVGLNFQLVIDTDFNTDLLNRSSNKFMALEENIKMTIKRHFNKSSIFMIYDVRVLKFSMGSVQADIQVLAVINTITTGKVEALNHLVEGLDSAVGKVLNVTAITVLEKPQPPEDLKVTNVQTRYITLSWNQPKYGSLYRINNYTIERKKDSLDNFTVIETLPYSRKGMTMKNLEPSTEYTFRVSSNNKYGRSDGVFITQSTLHDRFIRDLVLIIVLPLTLAVLFIVIVCVKVRPTCKSKPEKYETQLSMRFTGGDWLELPTSNIQLQEKLGEGAFGEAYKGLVRTNGQWQKCAVKKLKENATERERRDLMNELQIMVTVGEHPNVISLIGACTRSGPILVVVRLAENGCLLHHLKKNRKNPYVNVQETSNFTHIDELRIARDIANGMLHLASKKCVHRDLAARNVLLDENNVAMVSDFGMSRDVYESGEYEQISGGLMPVRWMAIESLEDYTFNTMTDVWSFGVVLWEIETGGKMPYSGLGGMEVVEFVRSGQRLKQPDGCPDEIYEIMMSCWRPDPSLRPKFSELVTSLEQELEKKGDSLKNKNLVAESQESVNLAAEVDNKEFEEKPTSLYLNN